MVNYKKRCPDLVFLVSAETKSCELETKVRLMQLLERGLSQYSVIDLENVPVSFRYVPEICPIFAPTPIHYKKTDDGADYKKWLQNIFSGDFQKN